LNPVSYIVQKLLVSGKRKPDERAKDVLYIHDTLELFGSSIPELRAVWFDQVRPQLVSRTEAKARQSVKRLFSQLNDPVRQAALMTAQRKRTPEAVLEVCATGLRTLLG